MEFRYIILPKTDQYFYYKSAGKAHVDLTFLSQQFSNAMVLDNKNSVVLVNFVPTVTFSQFYMFCSRTGS